MAEAEVDALMAIYCSDGEFTMLNTAETENGNMEYTFAICLTCSRNQADCFTSCTDQAVSRDEDNVKVKLTFILPGEYPTSLPAVSIDCHKLNRQQTSLFRQELLCYAATLKNEYMVMDLIMWVSQHIWEYITCNTVTQRNTNAEKEEPTWITILHIDHMRSQQKYIKTITSWVTELNLTGMLLLQGHLILLILQGQQSALKEYMVRHKTQKVDVDSGGRSCKEKMMSVLCELALPGSVDRCPDFTVRRLESQQDLVTTFQEMKLEDLYKKYVVMLTHTKS